MVDPQTGRTYVEKRRHRYNEPGQPRELTFPAAGGTRSWRANGRASGFGKQSRRPGHGSAFTCGQAEDWEWSSARWYAGTRRVKIEMDCSVLVELALPDDRL
jgi:hypothetical protein